MLNCSARQHVHYCERQQAEQHLPISAAAQPGQAQRQQVREPDDFFMSKVHSELHVQLQRTQQGNLTVSKAWEQSPLYSGTVSYPLWQRLICYPSEVSQRRASRSQSHCKALHPNCGMVWWDTCYFGCDTEVWQTWGFSQLFIQLIQCSLKILAEEGVPSYFSFLELQENHADKEY